MFLFKLGPGWFGGLGHGIFERFVSFQGRDTMVILSIAARARLVFVCLSLAVISSARGAGWETTLPPFTPGTFPEARPLRVRYNFGWGGYSAAKADIRLEKLPNGQHRFEASGGTMGLARTLWSYDLRHSAVSDAGTLRPIRVSEVENIRSKRVTTELKFSPEGVVSEREERKGEEVKSKTRRFDFPNVLSLNSALLFLRTQSMADGAVHRAVVYPATSAYLCTVTVLGRERISVPTGTYEAFKLDVQLDKIGKDRDLLPHKKFRKATVWLSNDTDRLLLRIEAQIFIGKVFAEIRSVEFGETKP